MSNQTTEQTSSAVGFGGQEWLMKPNFTAILISLVSVVVVFGGICNIVLIISIWRTRKLRTSANMIVVFMCAIDLCRVVHMFVFNLVTAFTGRWQYDHTTTCTYAAFMVSFAPKATGFSLGVVSLNRVLMITKHELYCKVFTIKNTMAILVSVVLGSLALSLPVAVKGILIFILFSNQTGSCFAYDANPKKPFQISSIFFAIILPSLIMIPCYSWIFVYVRRSKRRVAVHNAAHASSVSVKEELRSALAIFLTYITYLLFYVPLYASYFVYLAGVYVPNEVLVVSSLLTDFHRFIRPFLYPLLGSSYRQAIVSLFSRGAGSQTQDSSQSQQLTTRTNVTGTNGSTGQN